MPTNLAGFVIVVAIVLGRTHFLEHLLFLGTEKYPDEQEYRTYLGRHAGDSNAFTSGTHTQYVFNVDAAHLEGALDRFAQFFIAPRFDASCVERELHAIVSEHKGNLQSQARQFARLRSSLADPRHPYSKFGTGNLETLLHAPARRGVDVRAALIDFFHRYYSANLMRLVVIGKEPLDVLCAWAARYFSPIANLDLPIPEDAILGHPWAVYPESSTARKLIRVKSPLDGAALYLRWAFPQLVHTEWRSSPTWYLCMLLNYRGSGSLADVLQQRNLITSLAAAPTETARQFNFFSIGLDLTEKGAANVDEVVGSIFDYLARLRELAASPDGLPRYFYDEQKTICDLGYRYTSPVNDVSRAMAMANLMHMPIDPEWMLVGDTVLHEWRPELVAQALAALTTEVEITVTSASFPADVELNRREPWYGTAYRIDELPESLASRIARAAPHPDLDHPRPNPFAPLNAEPVFTLDATAAAANTKFDAAELVPHVVWSSKHSRQWLQRDGIFGVPQSVLMVRLRSPVWHASEKNHVLFELFITMANNVLTSVLADAAVAGYSAQFEDGPFGLELTVSGYTEKLSLVAKELAVTWVAIASGSTTKFDQWFAQAQQQLLHAYSDANQSRAPLDLAALTLGLAMQARLADLPGRVDVVRSLSVNDLRAFATDARAAMFIESYALTNAPVDIYLEWMDDFFAHLGADMAADSSSDSPQWWAPLSGDQLQSLPTLYLPLKNTVMVVSSSAAATVSPADRDSEVLNAVVWRVQLGDVTDSRTHALLGVFDLLTQDTIFHALRTQRQLGYIVTSGRERHASTELFAVSVQGELAPELLEAHIEDVIAHDVATVVRGLTAETLTDLVEPLLAYLGGEYTNFNSIAAYAWTHPFELETYDFGWWYDVAQAARTLCVADVVEFYETLISPASTSRRKLSVHVLGAAPAGCSPAHGDDSLDVSNAADTVKVLPKSVTLALPVERVEEKDLGAWCSAAELLPSRTIQLE
ncbi:metalloprotease [Blastocladiella emersonii ATCC 22665]|nr:metalloprotease [Blastocladiella emersonii ATCC 22665]